jgi:hypothetical protein
MVRRLIGPLDDAATRSKDEPFAGWRRVPRDLLRADRR